MLDAQAHARGLIILGGFHPTPDDALDDTGTLVLLGPDEPRFWQTLQTSPDWDHPDPVDTWSRRVIGDWAEELGAQALFPFGGPPFHPFIAWAKRSGHIHASPAGLLVHHKAGLFVSFRGALALPQRLDLPAPPPSPCLTCQDQPCRTACPVDALKGDRYDVEACKAFLRTPGDCLSQGCRARRACPVSQTWGRTPDQSAHHMRVFLGD